MAEAITRRPARIATKLGILGGALYTLTPHVAQTVTNAIYRAFPDDHDADGKGVEAPSVEQVVLGRLLHGIHF
ncbi:hypothetical protein [Microvirga subterranea]|uniref:Uncharacterized protein n=1 Tax=Microvirga subterranea TaxID=186651 RepID=A0A370HEI2_9HYPH|nr:hypothetical protein [Microvirga subterranea]RDI55110.1 hypothetical protein DES45_11054 [Microvirga subterranea]